MFCIKCGLPAKAGNFCEKCFLEKERLFELDNFTLYVCPVCGKNKDDIDKHILANIRSEHRLVSCKIKKRAAGNRIYVTLSCTGLIKPLKNKVDYTMNSIVFVKKKKCEKCVKLLGGYYEAVFQIRGSRSERIIKKLLRNESIVKIEKLKNGYDIRLVDKKIALKIINQLRGHFNIKESYKLVGEKNGKKLYRNYYAIR